MYLIILVVIFLSAVQYLVRAHHFLNFQNYYCKIYFENYRICYLFLIVKVFLTASFGLYKIWNTYYRMLNLRVKIIHLSESQHSKKAVIAQLGERQTEDLKVPGSIPGRGIFLFSNFIHITEFLLEIIIHNWEVFQCLNSCLIL